MRERGEEVYHLAFGQSPFSIPRCFVDALKENAHINAYLPVAGKITLEWRFESFYRTNG